MDWSIVEVSRSAGVTSRTLRFSPPGTAAAPPRGGPSVGRAGRGAVAARRNRPAWAQDETGLLEPSSIGTDGYRRYDERALLRLQRILVLRALGLPLKEIGAVLDAEQDELATLRGHHERLVAERDRLTRMAATVGRTIDRLERNGPMTTTDPEELFDGFDEHAYAEEARERWPEQAAASEARTAAMTEADKIRLRDEYAAEMHRMAALLAAGTPPEAPEVQEEIEALHARVSTMWTPTAAAFTRLGATYVDDDRFRATYEKVAPGLAEFYRDAMAHFASTRLT